MALVSTGGIDNIESDVALAAAGVLTANRRGAGLPVTVVSITCGPISTAAGAQCGLVQLRDNVTVRWKGYVFFTATAAAQSKSKTFLIGARFVPSISLNVSYAAITDATTAAVSFVWQTG